MNTFLYNPDQKSKDEIISEFVIRQGIYDEIMNDLEGSRMLHPEQHYLLVGQRGMGKTTLLLRLKYGIEDSPVLQEVLIPVAFTEEQYQVSELANLWEYVSEYLEDYPGFEGLYDNMEKLANDPRFEERAYDMLDLALVDNRKKIVLLIDNVGELLHKLEINEIHRLREILQTNNNIRIIGGSTNYIEDFLDYNQPFYEFFKAIRLDGLDKVETIGLILKLGELHGKKEKIEQVIRDTPGRIETMRILTGGVPRTISILFWIFLDYQHEQSIKDLYRVLDLVTPLYKHRMDDLPVQQQKILDAVARHWEPITVKELAAKTRLISKTLSAQLNQLEREQIVIKNSTGNKNKTYLIRERFWNIWYLMRYGRKDDKEKIIWLVKFLEAWLSDDDLKERIDSLIEKVKKSDIDKDQLKFFSKVYASLANLSAGNKLKLKSIEKETEEEITLSDAEWLECAKNAFAGEDYYESLKYIIKVKEWTTESLGFVIRMGSVNIWMKIRDRKNEFTKEAERNKMMWAISIGQIYSFLSFLTPAKEDIDYDEYLMFLKIHLELMILINVAEERSQNELFISIYFASLFIHKLIAVGLYHAIYKMVEESSIVEDGKTIFLKDQWKPFYLAIKYLYQPEELVKQPSELSSQAFSFVKILTKKEDRKELTLA
jgi:DNA-binding transcriptional regulator GbsR (MarR family)/GTPase SAR1 family protein